MTAKVHWYARARGIVYMGTYATQLEAWEAVRGLDGNPVPEATVWCERQVQGAKKGEHGAMTTDDKEESMGWALVRGLALGALPAEEKAR